MKKRPLTFIATYLCLCLSLLFISWQAQADCRGCCSGHGGVVCEKNITQCRDGSPLSEKCRNKSCQTCNDKKQETDPLAYDRKLYPHWIDANGNCRNTRHEVLANTSEIPVTYKPPRTCLVVSGRWQDPYSGKTIYETKKLDIDHIVPLSYAHKKGGYQWSRKKRQEFANDPENLVPVLARLNRQKGAKAPDEWLPPNEKYRCDYLKRWLAVEKKYKLKEKRQLATDPIEKLKKSYCQ